MKIVHLSDLHISSTYYVPEWGETVLTQLNDINPELLVVTGDLTMEGYMHEYDLVKDYFNKIKMENILVVPGNHDSRNEGFKIFKELFQTRFPKLQNNRIAIVGVDSSEPDIDDGHVGRENYNFISDNLSNKDKVKILALHHHLIPIPGTGRERNIPTDAGNLLELCNQIEINLVLSGHKHKPWLWKLENTYYITAGTATTRRLKGKSYPSFNVIEIAENEVILTEINVETKTSREIIRFLIG